MARFELAFELMCRFFKQIQGKENAVGLRFVQDVIPASIGQFDRDYVWVRIPMDAIISFSVPEDDSCDQQD